MASGKINNILYKIGTVSVNSGLENGLDVRQYGRVVTLNGYVRNCKLVTNTEVGIGTFSDVTRPPTNVRSICGVGDQPYDHPADIAYLIISYSGYIGVKSSINGTRVIFFSASYIV